MAVAKSWSILFFLNKLFIISAMEKVGAAGGLLKTPGKWWFSRSGWWISAEHSIGSVWSSDLPGFTHLLA
jgi:hypothetical protein